MELYTLETVPLGTRYEYADQDRECSCQYEVLGRDEQNNQIRIQPFRCAHCIDRYPWLHRKPDHEYTCSYALCRTSEVIVDTLVNELVQRFGGGDAS